MHQRGAKVSAADLHRASGVLALGYTNGIFELIQVRPGVWAGKVWTGVRLRVGGIGTVIFFAFDNNLLRTWL